MEGFKNRFEDDSGKPIDPAMYKEHVINGYKKAFNTIVTYSRDILSVISPYMKDDLRVRFVVRRTPHYTSTIHMLNLPVTHDAVAWEKDVIEQFKVSNHMLEQVSERLLNAEVTDLKNRDVPYFWLELSDNRIHHKSGPVQSLERGKPLGVRIVEDFENLGQWDLSEQVRVLEEFLDAPITQPNM